MQGWIHHGSSAPEVGAINLKRIEILFWFAERRKVPQGHHAYAQVEALLRWTFHTSGEIVRLRETEKMSTEHITPAKRKRLLRTFGSFPAGYTHDDLERFLDLLYGMFSDVYTMAELRQIVVSSPFDRSEHPRQFKLVELTDWLEVLVA
jgi:hypothetical protein